MEDNVLTDIPVDPAKPTIDTFAQSTDMDAIKELLLWIVGTNIILIACALMIAFFIGKASA